MADRTCDGCIKCCEGWLEGSAKGRSFYPGSPCHFASCNGCTIYADRPENPCRTYRCAWLDGPEFLPEWFKPSRSNLLCTWRQTVEGITFLDVEECGQTITASSLNWLFMEHLRKGFNLRYKVNGGINFIGDPVFVKSLSDNPHQ